MDQGVTVSYLISTSSGSAWFPVAFINNEKLTTEILLFLLYFFQKNEKLVTASFTRWALRYCALAPTVLAGQINPVLFEALYVSLRYCALAPKVLFSFFVLVVVIKDLFFLHTLLGKIYLLIHALNILGFLYNVL